MAEACYVPRYFQASFKGIAFDAMETTSEHGRRGAEGEFPFGESTAYADLGRKIRRYSIAGRFANNGHIGSTSALIAVCETPGPGLLIHPTRGAVLVACVKLSVKDNPMDEQGVTYVDLEFVEANVLATGLGLGGSLFGLGLTAITAAIGATFTSKFNLDRVRYYRVDEIQSSVSEAMGAIRAEFQKAIRNDPSNDKWSALAVMKAIENDPAQIRSADDAFDAFKRATRTLSNATSGQPKYDAFKNIANRMAQVSTLPDEAGETQDAVFQMTRLLAVTNMARAALEVDIASLDLALEKYDEVVTILDEEIAVAYANCDDYLHIELRTFSAQVKEALLTRAYKLPALIEYDFGGTVHSLVAAYEIFDDAKRFAEIEARNPQTWPFAMGPSIIASRV